MSKTAGFIVVGVLIALMGLSGSTFDNIGSGYNSEGVSDAQAAREAARVEEQRKRDEDRANWEYQQQQSQKDGTY